jgi:CspA family cold shock protein
VRALGVGCFLHLSGPQHTEHREDQMATGTVKWFSDEKGYGFITPSDGAKDLFVHHSDILGDGFKTLAEGSEVTYEASSGDKGPKAINVQAA